MLKRTATMIPGACRWTSWQYVSGDKALEQFSGQELDEQTGWYHFGQRDLMAIYGRWPSPDRFADKYPSHSPYSYAANDPVRFIDVNGDSVNVSQLDQQTFEWLTGQLAKITGLTLSVNDNGMLIIDPDADVNTDGTSETARDDLMSAIGHENTWLVQTHKGDRPSHIDRNDQRISLNLEDIRFNEENTIGVSSLTRGIGMTLLHELNHTPIVPSGGTSDDGGHWKTGSTVNHMNVIRQEVTGGGRHRMGIRQWYGSHLWDNRGAYIPFNRYYTWRVYSRPR